MASDDDVMAAFLNLTSVTMASVRSPTHYVTSQEERDDLMASNNPILKASVTIPEVQNMSSHQSSSVFIRDDAMSR